MTLKEKIKTTLYKYALQYVASYDPTFDAKLPDRRAKDRWTIDVHMLTQGQTGIKRKEVFSKLHPLSDYTTDEDIKNIDLNSDQYPNLVTSLAASLKDQHLPVIDLDVPAKLVPSIHNSHSHLYIDLPMEWEKYKKLLLALAEAGLVEKGYADASIARGFSAVRRPDSYNVVEQIEKAKMAKELHEFLDNSDFESDVPPLKEEEEEQLPPEAFLLDLDYNDIF